MVEVVTSRNNATLIVLIILVIVTIIVILLISWRLFTDTNSDDTIIQGGTQCITDAQCPGNSTCNSGFCVSECQTLANCPENWQCVNGNCEPQCLLDADCPTAWSCIQGTCIQECQIDGDCPPGQTCNSGTCQPLILGCAVVNVPQNIVGGITAPGEITISWDQANNATGYIAYISGTPGFNVNTEAIDSVTVLEPIRKAVFQGLANGTYYVKVVSTSATCSGTIPSSELITVLNLPPVFKLCLRSNNNLCLADTRQEFMMTGSIELVTTGATTFEFHSNPGGAPPAGNHLRSRDSPMNSLDPSLLVCFGSNGRTNLHSNFVSNWPMGSSGEYFTYNTTTGRIESDDGKFLTVATSMVGGDVLVPMPSTPQGIRSEWDLISP